jgi:hypothetical protein
VRRCALLLGIAVLAFAPSFVRADSQFQLTLEPRVTILHQRASSSANSFRGPR